MHHAPPRELTLTGGHRRAVRVSLSGELDIATVPRVDPVLRRAQADAELVILDLRDLEFVDWSGMQLVLAADRRARRSDARLVVVRGPADVQWLFGLVGLDRQLELVDEPPAGTAGHEILWSAAA